MKCNDTKLFGKLWSPRNESLEHYLFGKMWDEIDSGGICKK